jgi:UDP-N-acetyl-D-mannosaminuronic acid dehydrogenase
LAIVGMGHVGLPLGIAFAEAGLRVLGIDSDANRRKSIELGKMPFHEPGADEPLHRVVQSGHLSVHEGLAEAISVADVFVLCVGTPLAADLRPDYDQLRSALEGLAPHLKAGQLLILRSTVSSGTSTKIVRPYVERRVPAIAGKLLMAACPERIAEGKVIEELAKLPEIVGGLNEASTEPPPPCSAC